VRVLKACGIILLLMSGCTPQAALTPQAAFHDLQQAFLRSDAAALERQLSTASVKRVRRMASLFSNMDDRQRAAVAKRLQIDEERIKRLSVRDWCALAVRMDKGLREAASCRIVGIDRSDGRATIRVDNGMELYFVKEGPYWKLDIRDL